MAGYLGFRSKEGALSAANPFSAGGWAVAFTPEDLAIQDRTFEVFHIAVQGPAQPSCNLQVYLDTIFYSATVRGDVNDYDPNQPIPVRSGQTINFYWDTTATPAPIVSIFLQQSSLI
jgi:hypothetical protein